MKNLKTFTTLMFAFAGFSVVSAQTGMPELRLLTDQISAVKTGDAYKLFKLTGGYGGIKLEGKPPANPKNLKQAFDFTVTVSAKNTTTDSTDAMGNPHLVNMVFTDVTGVDVFKIGSTGGVAPYKVRATNNGTPYQIYLIGGDFYICTNLGDNQTVNSTQIEYVIAKKKPDIKKEEEVKKYMTDYINSLINETEKIIAAAIEKQRKENSLEGRNVKKIELVMKAETVTPGENTQIGIVATLKDGTQLKTKGFAGGNTYWSDYKVTVKGGSFNNGSLTTSTEFNAANNDEVTFTIESVYKPEFKVTKTVNISYAKSYFFLLGYSGNNGFFGNNGTDGHCLKGKKAGSGKPGNGGYNGTDAGNVEVKIHSYTHARTSEKLIKYEITCNKGTFHIVTAATSEVTIKGDGGNGGNGGDGGHGGDISASTSNGEKCNCASTVYYMAAGGRGGDGGNGGNGANIAVWVDPSVAEYNLKTSYEAGFGGSGGRGGTSRALSGCHNDNAVRNAKENLKGSPGNNGRNGNKGSLTVKKQAVTLNW